MHLRNFNSMLSVALSQKPSGDPDHTSLGDKFFTLGVGLAIVDPLAKFKQRSLIHSRNIKWSSFYSIIYIKFQKNLRFKNISIQQDSNALDMLNFYQTTLYITV